MKHNNGNKIWVTKLLESTFPFRIQNPILSSMLKICMLPNMYFIAFCVMRYEYMTTEFLVGYILAMIGLNLGDLFSVWLV